MIEGFIIILAVGFVVYYLIRHPIKSIKIIAGGVALMLLGLVTISAFTFGMVYLIHTL
jgi:hypothetical protein